MTKRWTVTGCCEAYDVRLGQYRTTPRTDVRSTRQEAQELADRMNNEQGR